MNHEKLKQNEGRQRRLFPPVRDMRTGAGVNVLWKIEHVDREQLILASRLGTLPLPAIDVKSFHAPDVLSLRVQVVVGDEGIETQRMATTEVVPIHPHDVLERAIDNRYEPLLAGFGGKPVRPELPFMASRATRDAWFAQRTWNPDGSVSLPLGEHAIEDKWWGKTTTEVQFSVEELVVARRQLEQEEREGVCHPLEGFGNTTG